MTAPRRVLSGTTLLISRRCLGRMFLLRPSAPVNQLIIYLLAVLAGRYGIQVHCFCVLSNHFHLVITDLRSTSPAFMRDLCALVARYLNALNDRCETFWAPGSYSAVTLTSPEDALDKMAYVLANPAAAHLVRTGCEWPGLWTAPSDIGGPPLRAGRPTRFFRKRGPLPDSATLQLACPPAFSSVDEMRAQLEEKVRAREEEAERQRRQAGRPCLGARKVLEQPLHNRPTTAEHRNGLNPRIASRDKWRRIEAISRLKEFLRAYREAWEAFVRGVRDVVFPAGTYWARVAYGATCAQAP